MERPGAFLVGLFVGGLVACGIWWLVYSSAIDEAKADERIQHGICEASLRACRLKLEEGGR